MKKFITSIAIATIFCLIFAACGNDTEATQNTSPNSESTTEEITKTDVSLEEDYNIEYLHDYNQPFEANQDEWMLDEKTKYSYGKFYYENAEIFDTSTLDEKIDPEDVRLLGCSISSNGTKYIGCKHLNKIWLLVESNQEFTARLIADDAVDHCEQMIYPNRTDRYSLFYNEDAVQYERTIIYRSIYGGLKQVNLLDNFVSMSPINYSNPVLVYDYSGVFWLEIKDFSEVDYLIDLVEMSLLLENHPYTYIDKDGQSIQYELHP